MNEKNEYDVLKLENQICFPLYACARKVVNKYTPFLKPLGITYTQYLVFMVLWENQNITVGELGRKLYLDNGTLTPLLKKMEQLGYITRKRNDDDERVVTISLTAQGEDLREQAKEIPLKMKGCTTISQEQAKTLYTTLYEILDTI